MTGFALYRSASSCPLGCTWVKLEIHATHVRWTGRIVCKPKRITYATMQCADSSSVKTTTALMQELSLTEDKHNFWRWAMIVAYDGTKYSGWQIQPRRSTVQATIEDALFQITGSVRQNLAIKAAGRTDAGVHAWGQVVHFNTPFKFNALEPLHVSLNAVLPQDVRILEIRGARSEFHACYSALRKTYHYKVYTGPIMDPFQRMYAHFFPFEVDVASMQDAASQLIGEHNFSAFANSCPRAVNNPIRKITKFSVFLKDQMLMFEVEGTGFFYKQVRNMVGLLLEVGRGSISVCTVADVLVSKRREVLAKYAASAPSYGLYLKHVEYDENLFYSPSWIPNASFGSRDAYKRSRI